MPYVETIPARLLLIGPVPPPSGGIASHVAELSAALRGVPCRCRVIALPPGRTSARDRAVLVGELVRSRAAGDLVHLHTNGHNAGSLRLAWLVGALAGRTAILTLHSGLAVAFLAARSSSARAAFGHYARIVCVQEGIAAALVAMGIDRARLVVAPAFSPRLPPGLPPPGLAAIRRRHEALLAAAIGVGPEYGAPLLLEAFARARAERPGAGLVLFGPAARDERLDAHLDRLALRDAVHRYGDLPRGEALGVIAAADVFVRPTLADGDAVSVREALALGRRVVASDASPRPGGVTLFASGDPAALARAIATSLASAPPAVEAEDGVARVIALYRELGLRTATPPEPAALARIRPRLEVAAPPPAGVSAAGVVPGPGPAPAPVVAEQR